MDQIDLPDRATDANNDPSAGALIDVFVQDTVTRATIYADEDGSALLPNPVVADGNGVIPQVFYNGSDALTAIIKTAAGVTLRTIDPVARQGAVTAQASEISHVPTTRNTATNVQTALDRALTSWDVVSSVTDDTADKLLTVGSGGVLTEVVGIAVNLNLATPGTFTRAVSGTTANVPSGAGPWTVQTYPATATSATQFAQDLLTEAKWMRTKASSTWGAWDYAAPYTEEVVNGTITYLPGGEAEVWRVVTHDFSTVSNFTYAMPDTFAAGEYVGGWMAYGQTAGAQQTALRDLLVMVNPGQWTVRATVVHGSLTLPLGLWARGRLA